ncbi:peptidoglycan DD-metalloendopeptidase family protein [Apibacter sp. HY039]|uniref:peptidoglycan DD-metalloendopeptidase family protein n=1 Tax=Apibacter sp. HY039 TaxID=2501476 RepID=UPI000FEBBE39|nr:peptidoglycan DD-metalloendopeptidase family protein [Apibacter sp. HY039]
MYNIFKYSLLLFSTLVFAQKPLNKCFYFKFDDKNFKYIPYNPSNVIVIYSKKDKKIKSISEGTVIKVGELSKGTKIIIIKKNENLFVYSGINKISKKIRIGSNVIVGEFLGSLKKEEGYFKFDFQVFNDTNSITYKENIECDVREK